MNSNESIKVKCLIIDDEAASHKVLQHFIKQNPKLCLFQTCFSSQEAFEILEKHQDIELLFLDINMPDETGLDFYKRLVHPPQVIFTTAYAEYALDGFELNATDYLLKPIAYQRFLKAVEKALDRLSPIQDEYIMLNQNKTLHKVLFSDIIYAEAAGDYVKVQTTEDNIIIHSTFSGFMDLLPTQFFRIHKSFLVNSDYVKQLQGNQLRAGDYHLPIGATFKNEILLQFRIT